MMNQILLNNQKLHRTSRHILPMSRKNKIRRTTLSRTMFLKEHREASLMTMLIAQAQIIWFRAKSKSNHKIVYLPPIQSKLAKIVTAKINWSLWSLRPWVCKLRVLVWDTQMSLRDLNSFRMDFIYLRCNLAKHHSPRVFLMLILWQL